MNGGLKGIFQAHRWRKRTPMKTGHKSADSLYSELHKGNTSPLGATVCNGGVNFSVFARDCSGIKLLLFDHADDATASRIITLDPRQNRTYHYWHTFVPDIGAGQLYGYQVAGPFDPQRGLRFDPDKHLIDPYGRAIAVPSGYDRKAACMQGSNTAQAMKSVVADPRGYDWEGDMPLKRSYSQTIIYEMHVAGFTMHPSSQFLKNLTVPFYGTNRKTAKVSQGLRDSFWLQGMLAGFNDVFDCIKAFSETDFTKDLKRFDVPTLIIHGDDD
jgi:pullulanase/glycogen debranching enzyme